MAFYLARTWFDLINMNTEHTFWNWEIQEGGGLGGRAVKTYPVTLTPLTIVFEIFHPMFIKYWANSLKLWKNLYSRAYTFLKTPKLKYRALFEKMTLNANQQNCVIDNRNCCQHRVFMSRSFKISNQWSSVFLMLSETHKSIFQFKANVPFILSSERHH